MLPTPDLRQNANLIIITGNLAASQNKSKTAGGGEKAILDSISKIIKIKQLAGQVSIFPVHGQSSLGAAYRYFSRQGSVFALTALYEPFGLAPLEAMAAGLPAVVTKNGGPSESMVHQGQDLGILIDPTNLDEIGQALNRLISNPELWTRFAEIGYQRVKSHYVWKETAARYANTLEQAQNNHRSSSVKLSIHPYFINSSPENDLTLDDLAGLYFEEGDLGYT